MDTDQCLEGSGWTQISVWKGQGGHRSVFGRASQHCGCWQSGWTQISVWKGQGEHRSVFGRVRVDTDQCLEGPASTEHHDV